MQQYQSCQRIDISDKIIDISIIMLPNIGGIKIALNERKYINKTYIISYIDFIDIFANNRIAVSSMQYGLSCECVAYRYNILFLYNFQHCPLMGRNFSRISFLFLQVYSMRRLGRGAFIGDGPLVDQLALLLYYYLLWLQKGLTQNGIKTK